MAIFSNKNEIIVNPCEYQGKDLIFNKGVAKYSFNNGYKLIAFENNEQSLYSLVIVKHGNCVCRIFNPDYDACHYITYKLKWLEESDEFFYISYIAEEYGAAGCDYEYDQLIAATYDNVKDEAYKVYVNNSVPDRLISKIKIKKDTIKNYLMQDIYGLY